MRPILQVMGDIYQQLSDYAWFKSIEIDKNRQPPEIVVVTNSLIDPDAFTALKEKFPNSKKDGYIIAGRIEKDE